MREQRRIRCHNHNDGTALRDVVWRKRVGILRTDLPANRNSGNTEILPRAVIALHEYTDGVAAVLLGKLARRGANPSLEPVANHAGAATNRAFFYRPATSGFDGVKGGLRLYVKPIDVVQPAVPRLRDDRQRPPIVVRPDFAVRDCPLDNRVAHDADAVCVGDHHGSDQKTGFFDPGGSSHFSLSMERPPACEQAGVAHILSARENCSNSRTHWPLANLELAFTGNERAVAYRHSGHVSDGV